MPWPSPLRGLPFSLLTGMAAACAPTPSPTPDSPGLDLVQQACDGVAPLTIGDLDSAATARVCEGAEFLYDSTLLSCSLWLAEADPE